MGDRAMVERKRVVEYLRKRARQYGSEGSPTIRVIIRDLAAEIEAGNHRNGTTFLQEQQS